MNKFIKAELAKCRIANIPEYDDNTTVLDILKQPKDAQELVVGKYYTIKLENYIVHPYDGFDLHDNWNNGITPSDDEYNCEIKNVMGKMVKIHGVGVHDKLNWDGWLPRKGFKIQNNI